MTPDELTAAGLQYAVDGVVATITLDRPQVRNAQTPTMWRALAAIGREIPDEVRVVVVQGRRSTLLGRARPRDARPGRAPVTARSPSRAARPPGRRAVGDHRRASSRASRSCATRGSCRSPRCRATPSARASSWRSSCDLRVVADDVQFSMKESALGLVPDLTGTKPLVESVGYARALEICATARMVGAGGGRGHRAGAGRRTRRAELDATVADLVGALTAPLAGAVRETKALLQAASEPEPRRPAPPGARGADPPVP